MGTENFYKRKSGQAFDMELEGSMWKVVLTYHEGIYMNESWIMREHSIKSYDNDLSKAIDTCLTSLRAYLTEKHGTLFNDLFKTPEE